MATAINNGTLHHWFPVQSGQYCEPNRTTVSGGTVASSGNVSIHWSPVQSGRIRARTITATSYNVVKLTLESVVSSVTTDTPASSAIDGTTETPTSTTTPVVISQRSILNFRYSCPTTAEEVAQCPYLCGDPSSGKFLACSFTDLSFIQSEDGPDTMVCQACMFPLDG
ncbi:hypothetical protein MMC06_003377 [Schaereria dolodes]|nr:hypothetical protein [Schaereria dolodes]